MFGGFLLLSLLTGFGPALFLWVIAPNADKRRRPPGFFETIFNKLDKTEADEAENTVPWDEHDLPYVKVHKARMAEMAREQARTARHSPQNSGS